MRVFRFSSFALALLPLVGACGDDDDPAGAGDSFSASLSGAEEVPPVTTPATGTATFEVLGDQINYTVSVTNLTNAVVSHIHIAPDGENGPVRLNLCGTSDTPACATGTGVLIAGSNGVTVGTPAITFDELVEAMRAGNTYVNVHTDNGTPPPNTGAGDTQSGEIRGQIVAD
jgi:hypothetical protein